MIFHKHNQNKNPDDYFLAEALLYIPYRIEEELESRVKNAAKDGYELLKEQIKAVQAQVMEHLKSNEELMHMVEEANNKANAIGEQLDPQGEPDIIDCELEDLSMHPDYEHLDIEDLELTEKRKSEKIYRLIEVDDIQVLCEKPRNLDFYQRTVVHNRVQPIQPYRYR